MIIYPPTSIRIGADRQLSARIKLKTAQRPSELWFRFREVADSNISTDSDPFVVALLLLAMQNRESIEVRGSISRKLFNGLSDYQQIYHSWFPNRFHRIEIHPTALRDDADLKTSSDAEVCAFSGGVDSFYTLLSLLGWAGDTPKTRLTHAVFMAGFDMPLHLTESIGELTRSYDVLMKNLGVEFVIGSTNIRHFVNSVDWTNAHGQALAATALFFKNTWRRFYIPSSYTSNSYPKWGTHPSLDHLLSTDSLEFRHHGADANRVQKLTAISRVPETYERLRVCWIQDLGLRNCGRCEKCIRTMVALEIIDALPKYKTFGQERLTGRKVRQLQQRTHQSRLFAGELIREAAARRKIKLCLNLGYSLLKRELFYRNPFRRQLRVLRSKQVNRDRDTQVQALDFATDGD